MSEVERIKALLRASPGTPEQSSVPGVSPNGTHSDLRRYPSGDTGDTGDSTGVPEVSPTPERRTWWEADELLAAQLPVPRWAVPGIVPEGFTVLAGSPKVGKSWLSLGLAVSVAAGGKALSSVRVESGPVLYLALEDTARRLQDRLRKVLGSSDAPKGLTIATACPPIPAGGDHVIAGWIEKRDSPRLIVIDVFARVRGAAPPNISTYDADYLAASRIKAIADHYSVPVIVVHHTRKARGEDFLDEVSGTQGIAGAADAVLVLKRLRGKADGMLQVTGRDVEEAQLGLEFSPEHGRWSVMDEPAEELVLGDTRGAVLRYIRDHPGARPKQISEDTGMHIELAKKTARRMSDDGQLDTDGQGRYFVPLRGQPGDTSTVPGVPAVPDTLFPQVSPGDSRGHSLSPGVPDCPRDRPNE